VVPPALGLSLLPPRILIQGPTTMDHPFSCFSHAQFFPPPCPVSQRFLRSCLTRWWYLCHFSPSVSLSFPCPSPEVQVDFLHPTEKSTPLGLVKNPYGCSFWFFFSLFFFFSFFSFFFFLFLSTRSSSLSPLLCLAIFR